MFIYYNEEAGEWEGVSKVQALQMIFEHDSNSKNKYETEVEVEPHISEEEYIERIFDNINDIDTEDLRDDFVKMFVQHFLNQGYKLTEIGTMAATMYAAADVLLDARNE